MDPLLQAALLTELDGQCNNFQLALDLMRQSQIAAADPGAASESLRRFWFYVQGMLAAVANISKILYPVKPACAPRGNHLRGLLGAAVTAPFDPNSRNMRNNYEHLDERIDVNWWNSPNAPNWPQEPNIIYPRELRVRLSAMNRIHGWESAAASLPVLLRPYRNRKGGAPHARIELHGPVSGMHGVTG